MVTEDSAELPMAVFTAQSEREQYCTLVPFNASGVRRQHDDTRITRVEWPSVQPKARAVTIMRDDEPHAFHYFRRPARNWKRGLVFRDHAVRRYEGSYTPHHRLEGASERRVAYALMLGEPEDRSVEEAIVASQEYDWSSICLNSELVISNMDGEHHLFWQASCIGNVDFNTTQINVCREYEALVPKLNDYAEVVHVY